MQYVQLVNVFAKKNFVGLNDASGIVNSINNESYDVFFSADIFQLIEASLITQ